MVYPRDAPAPAPTDSIDEVAAREVLSFIERIERIEEEKKALGEDSKSVYGEVRSRGYDAATVKAIVAIRRADPAKRSEAETMLDLYWTALARIGIDK